MIGELALGQLAQRREIISLLGGLPQAMVATTEELLAFIGRHQLAGSGIGYVDAQLLAATQLSPDAKLWTHDSRLGATASRLGCAVSPRSG